MESFLRDDGPRILSNGYKIVFLRPGKKHPIDKGWQKSAEITLEELEAQRQKHLTNGRAGDGIGIVTKYTPFVDVDVKRVDFQRFLRDWLLINLGFAPCRIGNPPKRGYLFRLEGKPFKKMSSPVFTDPDGNKAQVEILADGQQFASNHIHPDINQPYRWVRGEGPTNIRVDKLPELTEELAQQLIEAAVEWMRQHGWTAQRGQEDGVPGFADESIADDSDDIDPANTDPLGLSEEQIRKYVFKIPNNGDTVPYEARGSVSWLAMMAGVHHETGGSDEGKQIILEWSEQSSKHELEPGRFEKTWRSFTDGVERRNVTFRAVIKWAREADRRPTIQVEAGEVASVTSQAETALIGHGSPIYQRGPMLVRPLLDIVEASGGRTTKVARLHQMSVPGLVDYMSQAAKFDRFDMRQNKRVLIDPPTKIAEVMLKREGLWNFLRIVGVITTPTIRPDGSLLSNHGYDPATRLLLLEPPTLPPIPEKPSERQARCAAQYLADNLKGFPFVGPESVAVALSAILTSVLRGAIPVAPLHVARAPTPGSGKSFLWDIAAAISTGRVCPVISASNLEETEKRLSAVLVAGNPITNIDNILIGRLNNDFVNQAISQRLVEVRILGKTEKVTIESRTTIFATGNNFSVDGDMIRRTLVCDLDSGEERPELRKFAFDPVKRVFGNRGKFIAACLTVARWYVEANFPGLLEPLAGFEEWSQYVRSPLVALGYADPIKTIEKSREEDRELNRLRRFLTGCRDEIGLGSNNRKSAAELLALGIEPHFDDGNSDPSVLSEVISEIGGDSHRLGNWLRQAKNRVVDRLKLVSDEDKKRKILMWYVVSTARTDSDGEL